MSQKHTEAAQLRYEYQKAETQVHGAAMRISPEPRSSTSLVLLAAIVTLCPFIPTEMHDVLWDFSA
jgi:hypothetical protein